MIVRLKLTKPPGVDEQTLVDFITDALTSWGGQFHPDHPLFHSLPLEQVQVGSNKYKVEQ